MRSWQDADRALSAAAGPATLAQMELAKHLGLELRETTPGVVAAARLRVALQGALSLHLTSVPVEDFAVRLSELRRRSDPPMRPSTGEEAAAWIEYLHMVRRREALQQRALREGDLVGLPEGVVAEVASIGIDGRVYFRGGAGYRAWPDLVKVLFRCDDGSPEAGLARASARNFAARRRTAATFSLAKARALAEWRVDRVPVLAEIDEFERVIDESQDERAIQQHLQRNPHLLTALLGGQPRYCVPLMRFGSAYVPDFVIGEVDSLGVRWLLVELETPRTNIYLADGRQFGNKVRNALAQVAEWREWLLHHLADARQPREEHGLGLVDIRPNPRAIVIVGRRTGLGFSDDRLRHHQREFADTEVQTYDRMLDRLRGAVEFSGPPGANPFLHRTRDPDEF